MSKDLELQVSGPFAFLKIPNITILRCHCYKHLEVSRGLREVKEQVEKDVEQVREPGGHYAQKCAVQWIEGFQVLRGL